MLCRQTVWRGKVGKVGDRRNDGRAREEKWEWGGGGGGEDEGEGKF